MTACVILHMEIYKSHLNSAKNLLDNCATLELRQQYRSHYQRTPALPKPYLTHFDIYQVELSQLHLAFPSHGYYR